MILKSASFNTTQGSACARSAAKPHGAHASDLSEAAIKRAAETVKAVHAGARRPARCRLQARTDSSRTRESIGAGPIPDQVNLLTGIDSMPAAKMPA